MSDVEYAVMVYYKIFVISGALKIACFPLHYRIHRGHCGRSKHWLSVSCSHGHPALHLQERCVSNTSTFPRLPTVMFLAP